MSLKSVFIFFGKPGCGKDTVCNLLKDLIGPNQITIINSSDILREMLDTANVPFTRPNCAKLVEALSLSLGNDWLSKAVRKRIEAATTPYVFFPGARLPSDEALKNTLRFCKTMIIIVDTHADVRYARIISRKDGGKDGEHLLTHEEFDREDNAPNERYYPKRINWVINNNYDLAHLRNQVDRFYQSDYFDHKMRFAKQPVEPV